MNNNQKIMEENLFQTNENAQKYQGKQSSNLFRIQPKKNGNEMF